MKQENEGKNPYREYQKREKAQEKMVLDTLNQSKKQQEKNRIHKISDSSTTIINSLNEKLCAFSSDAEQVARYHMTGEMEQEEVLTGALIKCLETKTELEQDQLLSTVSHELMTPLVPILNYISLLKDGRFGQLTCVQQEKINVVESNAKNLLRLISNLLDCQKLQSGKITLYKELNNIEKIVRDAFSIFSQQASLSGIELTFESKGGIYVLSDYRRIFQVLCNLIDNAIRTVPEKTGRIKVHAGDDDEKVTVLVSDNGCFPSQGRPEDVFSKFYQCDMSTLRERNGLGLGLTICKGLIELHGGKIWIENATKDGTTIGFTLPKK